MLGLGDDIENEVPVVLSPTPIHRMSAAQLAHAQAVHQHELDVAVSYLVAKSANPKLRANDWANKHPFVPSVTPPG